MTDLPPFSADAADAIPGPDSSGDDPLSPFVVGTGIDGMPPPDRSGPPRARAYPGPGRGDWLVLLPWILIPALVIGLPVALGIALAFCCIGGAHALVIAGLIAALVISLIPCCALFGFFVRVK